VRQRGIGGGIVWWVIRRFIEWIFGWVVGWVVEWIRRLERLGQLRGFVWERQRLERLGRLVWERQRLGERLRIRRVVRRVIGWLIGWVIRWVVRWVIGWGRKLWKRVGRIRVERRLQLGRPRRPQRLDGRLVGGAVPVRLLHVPGGL
jgi:hypothetical protein